MNIISPLLYYNMLSIVLFYIKDEVKLIEEENELAMLEEENCKVSDKISGTSPAIYYFFLLYNMLYLIIL